MNPTRLKFLLSVALVLAAALVWNWIAGWGLVTVKVADAPLSEIVRSIERQAGVTLVTNLDPATPVSMDVRRVTVVEAVDVLAARLDANWNVAFVTGASRSDVLGGIAAVSGGGSEGFVVYNYPAGMFGDWLDTPPDPRKVEWKVSPSGKSGLQDFLDQFAQKTGGVAVAPAAWNPDVLKLPPGGPSSRALRSLAKAVSGQVEEVFLVSGSNQSDQAGPRTADPGAQGASARESRPDQPAPRRQGNPEWMEERALARIEELPPKVRSQAQAEHQERRAFWDEIRKLSPDERRAKMEARFNDPAVQQRMDEQMSLRDEKRGPEARADRYRRYVERKAQNTES